MPPIVFPEFRDQNKASRYPFADTATLQSDVEGLSLLAETFIDASLYPLGGGPRLYLSSVHVSMSPRQVTLTIGDATDAALATAVFDPLDPPELLRLLDEFDRPAGILLSTALDLAIFATWPTGLTEFTLGASEFAATCCIPVPGDGVRGLLTTDGDLLTGDVWLVGENGIVLREVDGEIRVDIVGDPLFRRRLCEPIDLFSTPQFVRTINQAAPNADGEYTLIVGNHLKEQTILRIYPRGQELVVEAAGLCNR